MFKTKKRKHIKIYSHTLVSSVSAIILKGIWDYIFIDKTTLNLFLILPFNKSMGRHLFFYVLHLYPTIICIQNYSFKV